MQVRENSVVLPGVFLSNGFQIVNMNNSLVLCLLSSLRKNIKTVLENCSTSPRPVFSPAQIHLRKRFAHWEVKTIPRGIREGQKDSVALDQVVNVKESPSPVPVKLLRLKYGSWALETDFGKVKEPLSSWRPENTRKPCRCLLKKGFSSV